MFRLSKAAEYAIRGILYLSLKWGEGASGVEEIARAQDVPAPYLSKLLQILTKKGFVKSYRGAEGGFVLMRPPRDITLLEVIEAVEGPIYLNDCLIRAGYCPRDRECPVHDVWKEAQHKLLECLRNYTFEDLARAARRKMEASRGEVDVP